MCTILRRNISIAIFCAVTFVSYVVTQVDSECIYKISSQKNQGVLLSSNYPFNYTGNKTCKFLIYPNKSSSPNEISLCFRFWRFRLGGDQNCTRDYLNFPGNVRYCETGHMAGNSNAKSAPKSIWLQHCWETSGTYFLITHSSASGPSSFYATFKSVTLKTNQQPALQTACIPDVSTPKTTLPVISFAQSTSVDPASHCHGNCSNGYLCHGNGKPSCNCSQHHAAPCSDDEWTCFNSQCIPKTSVCDVTMDCLDGSDETYTHAGCKSRSLFLPDACDFELDTCGLLGLKEWLVTSASNARKGPYIDHTYGSGRGRILKVKHWWNQFRNDGSGCDFQTQIFSKSHDTCFSAWYYLHGDDAGVIIVYLMEDVAWFDFGNHGDGWHNMQFVIPAGYSGTLKLVYKADHGSRAQFAVDDISFIEGRCQQASEISCTFQHNLCGWNVIDEDQTVSVEDDTNDVHHWGKINKQMQRPVEDTDKFSAVLSRGLVFRAEGVRSISTYLVSPTLAPHASAISCLRLMYSLTASSQVSVTVSLADKFPPLLLEREAKEELDEMSNGLIETPVMPEYPFRLLFELTSRIGPDERSNNHSVEFILHSVSLANGPCQYTHVGTTPPGTGEVSCGRGEVSCGQYECIPWLEGCMGRAVCRDGTHDHVCDLDEEGVTPEGGTGWVTNSSVYRSSTDASGITGPSEPNITPPPVDKTRPPDLVVDDGSALKKNHHVIVYLAVGLSLLAVVILTAIAIYFWKRKRKTNKDNTEMLTIIPNEVNQRTHVDDFNSIGRETDTTCLRPRILPTRTGLNPFEPPRYSFIMRRDRETSRHVNTADRVSMTTNESNMVWSTGLSRQPPSYETIGN